MLFYRTQSALKRENGGHETKSKKAAGEGHSGKLLPRSKNGHAKDEGKGVQFREDKSQAEYAQIGEIDIL